MVIIIMCAWEPSPAVNKPCTDMRNHGYIYQESCPLLPGSAAPLVICSDCYDNANIYSRTREYCPYAYLGEDDPLDTTLSGLRQSFSRHVQLKDTAMESLIGNHDTSVFLPSQDERLSIQTSLEHYANGEIWKQKWQFYLSELDAETKCQRSCHSCWGEFLHSAATENGNNLQGTCKYLNVWLTKAQTGLLLSYVHWTLWTLATHNGALVSVVWCAVQLSKTVI